MCKHYEPETARGKVLEALALRAEAKRMLTRASWFLYEAHTHNGHCGDLHKLALSTGPLAESARVALETETIEEVNAAG